MRLEDQVCSLESARRLQELGVPQESLFYWTHPYCKTLKECRENGRNAQSGKAIPWVKNKNKWVLFSYNACLEEDKISAFTVGELGKFLPFCLDNYDAWICMYKSVINSFSVEYRIDGRTFKRTEADTEAEARAKMLIYLLENKLYEKTNPAS